MRKGLYLTEFVDATDVRFVIVLSLRGGGAHIHVLQSVKNSPSVKSKQPDAETKGRRFLMSESNLSPEMG